MGINYAVINLNGVFQLFNIFLYTLIMQTGIELVNKCINNIFLIGLRYEFFLL